MKIPSKSEIELVRYIAYDSVTENPYSTGLIKIGDSISTGNQFKAFASKEISKEGFTEFGGFGEDDSTVVFRVRTTDNSDTAKPFIDGTSTTYGESESEFLYGRNREFKVESISVHSIIGKEFTIVQLAESEAAAGSVDMYNGSPINPEGLDLNEILSEERGNLDLNSLPSFPLK